MTTISYAQNLEDVVLLRALQDVKQGFYIDIGAFSPEVHSVTKAFYERGWNGINVEPNPECQAAFAAQRPRDLNLAVAVGDHSGTMQLHVFSDTGLSTLDASIAEGHVATGWTATPHEVPVVTLNEIFEAHVKQQTEVHFLKIDVEGFEAQVIRGNDWSRYRPWIVLLEATLPLTQVASHMTWESAILSAGYVFAYYDGLNRFYVSEEHAHLADRLAVPPNVFDDFKTIVQVHTERQLEEMRAERDSLKHEVTETENRRRMESMRAEASESTAEQLGAEVASLREAIAALQGRLATVGAAEAELEAMRRSRSWRITYPLRRVSQIAQRAFGKIGHPILLAAWTRAAASPRLKGHVLRWMHSVPRFAHFMDHLRVRLHGTTLPVDSASSELFASDPADLSAEAQEVLDLMIQAGRSRREID